MNRYCRICHNSSCDNHGKDITFLGEGWQCNYIPVPTNADRIRAMSDEELAKYLIYVEQGNFTIDCCDDRFCDTEHCCNDCTEAAIKWLQQPAEEATP